MVIYILLYSCESVCVYGKCIGINKQSVVFTHTQMHHIIIYVEKS